MKPFIVQDLDLRIAYGVFRDKSEKFFDITNSTMCFHIRIGRAFFQYNKRAK
jgi:hypothetical protein